MQFLYPGFLYALSAVLIPLIIHLFRFRRYRKVYFSNVRLIEDLQMEKQRRSRLKHILVLIARMLAIAALVLAFAQPYRPLSADRQMTARDNVLIYLDNSFSMETVSDDGSLFQLGREKAEEITAAYNPSDQFGLITNDFEGRHQRLYSREDFLDLLQAVELSPVSRDLDEILTRSVDMLPGTGDKATLYVISDFQQTFLPEGLNVDTNLSVFFIPLRSAAVSNLYIDTCWFSSPVRYAGQDAEMTVRVVNTGEGDYEKVPLRLHVNGQQRAVASLDIPAGQEVEEMVRLNLREAGWQSAVFTITDYPVTYDDNYHFVFSVVEQISVLSLHQQSPTPYLRALFRADSSFSFEEQDMLSIDYSRLGTYDLIILDNVRSISTGLASELNEFVKGGGSLVTFPGEDCEAQSMNDFFRPFGFRIEGKEDTSSTRVAGIDTGHPLFEGVFEGMEMTEGRRMDYPLVMLHYPIDMSSQGSNTTLMRLENGRPFLAGDIYGEGRAWVFASPLGDDYSSLARHAMIVPVMYRIAMMSRPMNQLSYTIGKDQLVSVPADGTVPEIVHMKNSGSEEDFIPEIRRSAGEMMLYTHGQVRTDGIYEIYSGEETMGYAAYNFDRRESQLEYMGTEVLEQVAGESVGNVRILDLNMQSTDAAVKAIHEGYRYYKWFILIALILLLIEVLLLRFMKG